MLDFYIASQVVIKPGSEAQSVHQTITAIRSSEDLATTSSYLFVFVNITLLVVG
jgi:hypothetical protein